MRPYEEWLKQRTGYDCHVREHITFAELASQIRAIIHNVPVYIDEVVAEKLANKPVETDQK